MKKVILFLLSSILFQILFSSSTQALDVTATNGSAAAIQDAVDQVAAAGGGNVYIPAGNFTFNIDFSVLRVNNGYAGVQVPSGVNVFGAGNNQTILYCPLSGWNYSDTAHGQDFAFQLRGGGGAVWNNTVILNPSYSNPAMMIINETVAPYDIEQLYVWNNTAVYSNGTSVSFDSKINNQGNFIANTNYFLRAPNQVQDGFTYTPYAYPHPLALTS